MFAFICQSQQMPLDILLTLTKLYSTSFEDHLCYVCLVFVTILRPFIAALWTPAGKGLTSWLLFVTFIVFLLLSHVVSWIRCGT